MVWRGVDDAKARHPMLGKLIDNIFVLALNRVMLPLLGTMGTAALGYGMTKISILDNLAHDVPALTAVVEKINDKIDKQKIEVVKHTVQLQNLGQVIENQTKSSVSIAGQFSDINRRFDDLDKIIGEMRSKADIVHDSQIKVGSDLAGVSQRLDAMTKRLEEDEQKRVQ